YTTLSSVNRIRNGQAALNEISDDLARLDRSDQKSADDAVAGETAEAIDALPVAPVEPVTTPSPFRLPMTLVDSVAFDRVSFRYPGSQRFARDEVSFSISRGSSVALVGRSGAGKTTVVDLLLGLFPVTDGEIRVDDTPLDAATIAAWRKRVGYVPQDV